MVAMDERGIIWQQCGLRIFQSIQEGWAMDRRWWLSHQHERTVTGGSLQRDTSWLANKGYVVFVWRVAVVRLAHSHLIRVIDGIGY